MISRPSAYIQRLGVCIGVQEPAGLIDQVVGCITNHKEEKDKKGRRKKKDLLRLLANTTSRGKRKEKSGPTTASTTYGSVQGTSAKKEKRYDRVLSCEIDMM
jgi:hypothetical protein